jgi:hypothetical protein
MLNRTDRFSGVEGVAGPDATGPAHSARDAAYRLEQFYAHAYRNTAPIGALAR